MRIAVIDLGTNTFNLIIVEIFKNSYETIFKTNIPVKLGEGGITKNIIAKKAFERGIDTIGYHVETINEYKAEKVYAFGTSALRTAKNGKDFVRKIKEVYDIDVQIIEGTQEAKYIYQGVKLAYELDENPVLILDIGGGSDEFIIANKNEIFWKGSFPIGVARLLEKFNPSDPIIDLEIQEIEQYFEVILKPLFIELEKYNITKMIGSSGAFDTFAELTLENESIEYSSVEKNHEIDINKYLKVHSWLINSTLLERLEKRNIEAMRVEMIVIASVLVNFIIKKMNLQTIIQSNYAMKEGVITDLIAKLNIK